MGKEKLLNSLIHNQAHYAILGGLQIQISYTLCITNCGRLWRMFCALECDWPAGLLCLLRCAHPRFSLDNPTGKRCVIEILVDHSFCFVSFRLLNDTRY